MRVLVVTPRYFPDTGGVERHVYETSRRLVERGVDVSVLTTDRTGRRPPNEEIEGVKILRVPAWPPKRDYYLAPRIYGVVADASWDIVHIQSWHTPVAPLAMLACVRCRFPFVVTPHGRGHSSVLRRPFRPLQRRMLRPLLRRSRQVIAVARFERDSLIRDLGLDPELVQVIPNGSDLLTIGEQSRVTGQTIIASIGRLEKFKGHHRILQALPYVVSQRPEVRLVIAGDGPYGKELHRLAQKLDVARNVTIDFFPMSERQGLAALLSDAALIVLLSDYETHPIAALEAAALGKPVLTLDVAGMSELAEDGLVRALPPRTSARQLGRIVLDQLNEPYKPSPFRRFSWDDCADALLRVYVEHAGSPHSRQLAVASGVGSSLSIDNDEAKE